MSDILGINYYFDLADGNDKVFDPLKRDLLVRGFSIDFKRWIESRYDVTVHTWDCIDWHDPRVKAVLYFDYSWRYARKDPFLKKIPFAKRALMMIEPANVNPSLYYIPFYRNRFHTIFTWDERLLRTHPNYHAVNVPVGAEPAKYIENKFANIAFKCKKPLVAVSRNRGSYMPQSTYGKRAATYRYFSRAFGSDFDLFGYGWSAAEIPSYRGSIDGSWDDKVAKICNYRFAICFENNASQPGYISEKILDCLCARCVPIYYGSKGIEKRIPADCYINFRDFRGLRDIEEFLREMSEDQYARYISAIDRFMRSDALHFFSTDHYFTTLAEGLDLRKRI